jgi:small subunit ribosomal protein S1
VELEPGVDGLVHVSELGAGRRVNHPSEVLKVGDRVEASVLGVDMERRRISLTLDQGKGGEAPAEPDEPAAAKPGAPEGQPALGSFGALLKESLDKRR